MEEYLIMKKMQHPNIVKVLHTFRQQIDGDNESIIVMEKWDRNLIEIPDCDRVFMLEIVEQVITGLEHIVRDGWTFSKKLVKKNARLKCLNSFIEA